MRCWLRCAVGVAAILCVPPAAEAQEGRQFGIGIGMQAMGFVPSELDFLPLFAPQIYVPIAVGDNLMLEPSLGALRVTSSEEFGGDSFESRSLLVRFGAGLLFLQDAGQSGRVYFGPRLGLIRSSTESESSFGDQTEQSRLDLTLAGVAGGEFFLTERFSLGGEVGLEYIRIGDPDEDGDPDVEESGSFLRTLTELRVRWYLQ